MKKIIFTLLMLVSAVSCGGGGGGSDDASLSNNACGVLGLPTKSAKIVEGTACGNLTSSPVVRVIVFDRAGEILGLCSGTMLTSNDVLTAAHCIPEGAFAGAVNYGPVGATATVFATNIVIHPAYVPSGPNTPSFAAFNDVAIFKLAGNVPVPSSPLLASRQTVAGDTISIFGYGTDENGDFDFEDLVSGEMSVDRVTSDHISATFDGSGSNTCQGDSGGPAYLDVNGVAAIAGVTSTGSVADCSEGDDSLFINITTPTVLNFILGQVPDARTL